MKRRFGMWKRDLVFAVALIFMAVNSSPVLAQSGAPQTAQKKNPRELVLLIKNASIGDFQSFSLLELNLLKNAVFAARGYRFAEDRSWLNEVFCGTKKVKKAKKPAKKESSPHPVEGKAEAPAQEGDRLIPNMTTGYWHLNYYQFPACQEGPALDEDQKRAIANIRVALFKKIKALGSIRAVDAALDNDLNNRAGGGYIYVLGKNISERSFQQYAVSMRRDLHGIHRMLQIMKNPEEFDSMELLGLFMGDILFLRNAIEAKYGKPFSGVQGWEISQLIGVVEQNASYNVKTLPPEVLQRIQKLEDIASKIQRSDLNDIPAAFRNRPVEFIDPYDSEGC
jgi:hypothetical protein